MRRLFAIGLLMLLSACASNQQTGWKDPKVPEPIGTMWDAANLIVPLL